MSVARGYGLNGRALYANIAQPMLTMLQFTVNHADTGGLGTTSVKSNGFVEAVFMNTNQTPGRSAGGLLNPNPQAGFACIVLKRNFNCWLSRDWTQIVPLTSTSTTSLTQNNVYTITALGNTTAAQWATAGLPAGFTPAVGQTFVSAATASLGGTGTVGVPGVPTILAVTPVGTPNSLIANGNIAANAGAQFWVQFASGSFTGSALGTHTHTLNLKNAAVSDGATTRVNAGTNLLGANTGSDITIAGGGANGGIAAVSAGTPSGSVAFAAAAPADGTIFSLALWYDGSQVTIDGL